jgi:putative methyltransferase (TIGR04325 family)
MRQTLETMPLIRPLLERVYERHFSGNALGRFRGVFDNFEQANLSAPKTKPLGFNCPEYTREFGDRLTRIFSFDYPVLFWLKGILAEGCRVFDLGGHVGLQYYAYSKYLDYPAGMSWMVCDLPEITRAGEDLARTKQRSGILFTNRIEDASGSDVLIAAGSLQYIQRPTLSVILSGLERKPRHLLLNKLPLYEGDQFVTLQNGGAAFHPQYVFNRSEFIRSLTVLGYSLVDTWTVETHSGHIPFHPESSFRYHSGLYLRYSTPATSEGL